MHMKVLDARVIGSIDYTCLFWMAPESRRVPPPCEALCLGLDSSRSLIHCPSMFARRGNNQSTELGAGVGVVCYGCFAHVRHRST